MTRFNDLSIRKKLIAVIVLISTTILIISSAIIVSNEIMTSKKELIERSMVEARFIGEYCIVYLSFNDSAGAANILKNVESIPTILAVRVYDEKNKLFSEFKKPGQEINAIELKTEVFSEFSKDHLHIFHPIFFEKQFYGTVFLKVSTRALNTTLLHFVLLMLGLVIILTVLSYFIAAKLQNIISQPILDLANATMKISKEADYSLRVHKQGNNEIGVLFAGFNSMLEQIEIRQKERDRAEKELKKHRDHLEQLVAERTADLKKSEEKFRTLADFTYDWEYWVDVDRRMLYVSPSCERISGFAPVSFYEDPRLIETLVHPDDKQIFKKHVEALATTSNVGEAGEMEFRIIDRNGRTKWIGHLCTPVTGENGVSLGRRVSNRDITERKQADEELQRQSVSLTAANKELDAFSYSVSHDLRAPLRGIDGWSLALLEDYGDQLDEQGRMYLTRVRTETQRMGMLIDDLLQLSRLNRTETRRKPVDLSGIVRALADRLRESAPDRAVEFIIQPGLLAQGDAPLLEAALGNLLDNAFKFTGKCTQARIEFGRSDGSAEDAFFVRDNGVGFDMAYANKLFGAFQRMHKTSDFPGSGIGLATVKRIVHRHGGRVWADAAVDRGATFYFTLEDKA